MEIEDFKYYITKSWDLASLLWKELCEIDRNNYIDQWKRLWEYEIDNREVYGFEKIIVVLTKSMILYALDSKKGNILWK